MTYCIWLHPSVRSTPVPQPLQRCHRFSWIRFSAPWSSESWHGTVGRYSTLLHFIHVFEPHLGHVTVLFRILTFSGRTKTPHSLFEQYVLFFATVFLSTILSRNTVITSHFTIRRLCSTGIRFLQQRGGYRDSSLVTPRTSQSYINCSNDARKIESTGGRK